jgi:hypothetical protein
MAQSQHPPLTFQRLSVPVTTIRAKQVKGWRLEQPEPAILKWRVPSGRTYATGPATCPI